jgi:mRNA interferase RelE/StbE
VKRIEWSPQAQNDARKLDRAVARRIFAALDRYAETGYGDLVRLEGVRDEYRLRVGDWRVRMRLEAPDLAVILRIRHRREAYR